MNRTSREITIPSDAQKETLAEFFGILTGDGFMNHYPAHGQYSIEIAGDSRFDRQYLMGYVTELIRTLFGIYPFYSFKKKQHTLTLIIRSKRLYYFLSDYGFPSGRKGDITILPWIMRNDACMAAFIGGFSDTDGCLIIKQRNYPVIKLCSKSEPLLRAIDAWLQHHQFIPRTRREVQRDTRTGKTYVRFTLSLSGHRNLERWMQIVGFSNEKHLSKYRKYGDGQI